MIHVFYYWLAFQTPRGKLRALHVLCVVKILKISQL